MIKWEQIPRSDGTTPSERFLSHLCSETFLRLWSYPNIYRDQRISETNSVGKEICDLLVVFDQHLLIFSDKSCAFPTSGDLNTDWSRWFRRAVKKSADQIVGAERWLKSYPDRVFLDSECHHPFPLALKPWERFRVHRIVVALNASVRCQSEFGGSGSLLIDPDIRGTAHMDPDEEFYKPFSIGWVLPEAGYVHVFDDITLGIVLRALDTVTDFVSYLDKKEALIGSGKLHWAPGEEDLLAVYLSHMNDEGDHDFPISRNIDRIEIEEQSWAKLLENPNYQEKFHADQESYLWDAIIEEFADHIFEATLLTEEPYEVTDVEVALRIMARERRVFRRALAKGISDKIRSVQDGKIGVRYILSLDQEGVGYVYLLFPYNSTEEHDRYRERRKIYLFDCCVIFAYRFREAKEVVGIATETGLRNGGRSHDLLYFGSGEWTPEAEKRAAEIQQERELLLEGKATTQYHHEDEYPEPKR